jgi:hypothetical protein
MNTEQSPTSPASSFARRHRGLAFTAFAAAGVLLPAACASNAKHDANPATATFPIPAADASATDAPQLFPPSNDTSHADVSPTFADPCALLTQTEVDTAAGQPLQPGKQVATLDDCQWTNSDFSASVDVTVSDWTAIKNAATANGTKTPAVITGVGDEALGDASLLSVRKGDTGFLLNFNFPNMSAAPDQGMAQAKVLAAAVLARLR